MSELLDMSYLMVNFGEAVKNMLTLMAMCTMRVFAAFMIMPPTMSQAIQAPVRNGMALMIGFFIAWGQPVSMMEDMRALMLLALLLKEALIGVLLGFAIAVVFWVAEGAGALIDNCAGFNNAQQTNPLSGEQSTPVSNLLSQLVIAGFYMLGGMVVCAGLLFESFRWWPLARLAPDLAGGLTEFISFQVEGYFSTVVKIAAPVMLVLVLIDLAFGLLAKTAEKLEPNNLAQPIKGVVATVMLALLVSLFFDQARESISLLPLQEELGRWMRGEQPAR